jgi:hypothetical protein
MSASVSDDTSALLPVSSVLDAPRELWLDGLRATPDRQLDWLWDGYLAATNVTLLTSQWKTGKTTLVSLLLAQLKGGGVFAGSPLTTTRAAIVSEESAGMWLKRTEKLDFGAHVCWFCRPFRGRPTLLQWQALIDRLAVLRRTEGVGLVIIDTLAAFLASRTENNANSMLDVLLPLQQLTELGMAVLILHHPRKKQCPDGQLARGSGALSGFADILIEMHPYLPNNFTDRRRRLDAYSRHAETPAHRLIELNAAGTEYASLGDVDDHAFAESWALLERVFSNARYKLTRQGVLEEWPDGAPVPTPHTLWRWLQKAFAAGRVVREGEGTKSKPYRYCIKSREKQLMLDPLESLREDLCIF